MSTVNNTPRDFVDDREPVLRGTAIQRYVVLDDTWRAQRCRSAR